MAGPQALGAPQPLCAGLCPAGREARVKEKHRVLRMEDRRGVYFTVYWSSLAKSDKYEIIKKVPSDAGIYELYSMDPKKKLVLMSFGKSWYGGLRNELRVRTDPELETDPALRAVLENYDVYYRYSLLSSSDDMSDILFFFARTYYPGSDKYRASGRYENIYVKEISADKIVTI
jgi:hypothetical protein